MLRKVKKNKQLKMFDFSGKLFLLSNLKTETKDFVLQNVKKLDIEDSSKMWHKKG